MGSLHSEVSHLYVTSTFDRKNAINTKV
uniref:Uncharacterized protein n=1 Tax=Anguilla anguilla TaxID=7936 RepID=A0A0E9RKN6_ANGAN